MEIEVGLVIGAIAGIAIPLMLQTGAIVWWASNMASRIRSLEAAEAQRESGKHPERLVKLETYVEIIQKQQDEQNLKLDRILALISQENFK